MQVRIIQSAYDTAHYNRRMGRGPGSFLKCGLAARLAGQGHEISVVEVDPKPEFPAELATGFAVMSAISEEVRGAQAEGAFPLVLAGNCNSAVGTVSGMAPRRTGVLWFDAHADFNTPETSGSGFLDGMGLSILAGHCWRPLAEQIPGYAPVPEENILLLGARDVDPLEKRRLSSSQITWLPDGILKGDPAASGLNDALDSLAERVDAVYLHVDLDVHDPLLAPANQFRPPGGLSPDRLREIIAIATERLPVAAAYFGAYDPEVDPEGKTRQSGMCLMETVLAGRAP